MNDVRRLGTLQRELNNVKRQIASYLRGGSPLGKKVQLTQVLKRLNEQLKEQKAICDDLDDELYNYENAKQSGNAVDDIDETIDRTERELNMAVMKYKKIKSDIATTKDKLSKIKGAGKKTAKVL
jgi:archaellum component FlaC